MSNVYFPAQVVVIFRRIFNVFSGLSISNQYLLKQAKETTQERDRERSSSRWPLGESWGKRLYNLRDEPTNQLSLTSASIESVSPSDRNDNTPTPGLNNETSFPSSPDPRTPKNNPSQPNEVDRESEPQDIIHKLLSSPVLYDPLRTPRHPIVLCHGLYGFDTRGPSSFPSMRMHYWSNVLSILRGKLGADVIITSVPGTGSISSRAEHLDRQLKEKARGRGVNFMAHSMGGLDCRHLITHCKPEEYMPLSLTTISTPHRGSPFMDWCSENLGLGKLATEEKDLLARASNGETMSEKEKCDRFSALSLSSLPSSFTTLLMSILDSPAYANLTSTYLQDVFNPATPDNPNVKYFSIAGRMPSVNVWHPFWLPKMVLDDVEQKTRQRLKEKWERNNMDDSEKVLWAREEEWGNDGLVTIQSAKWGEFLGVMEGCDHWELRGARGIEFGVDLPAIPVIGLGPPSSVNDECGGQNSTSTDERSLKEKDWGWFLKSWRKEEKIHQEAATKAQQVSSRSEDRKREREIRRKADDDVIKASTDKLSVVFDWLTDRVPTPPLPLLGGKRSSGSNEETRAFEDQQYSSHLDAREGRKGKKNELATKMDLERFYVSLSRKLYDEGL
ncbi:alpha/beta-hydrolase [Marasmius fiardii PR-910]|nr:alpha/beta-hydrolase [Marasmius fiardii PR-910]